MHATIHSRINHKCCHKSLHCRGARCQLNSIGNCVFRLSSECRSGQFATLSQHAIIHKTLSHSLSQLPPFVATNTNTTRCFYFYNFCYTAKLVAATRPHVNGLCNASNNSTGNSQCWFYFSLRAAQFCCQVLVFVCCMPPHSRQRDRLCLGRGQFQCASWRSTTLCSVLVVFCGELLILQNFWCLLFSCFCCYNYRLLGLYVVS